MTGEFLTDAKRLAPERLALYGALGKAACEAASIPCAFIFNESPMLESVYEAADCGFNVVMYADHRVTRDTLVKRVRDLTSTAHAKGIAVEAEYDELPFGHPEDKAPLTDVEEAAEFAANTGVDALAVSVGNVHVMTNGKATLDVQRVAQLAKRVSAALVLHGGTGIDESSLRDAIAAGVTKVNYGTVLKVAYLRAIADKLAATCRLTNPHARLGSGLDTDVLMAGRLAVREEIWKIMQVLGSCGQAACASV
jgi:fructose-bisphosphate aldolase class II